MAFLQVAFVGDDASIDTAKFSFVPISELPAKGANEIADVLGIVTKVSPLSTIVSQKNKKELQKRTLTLVDQDEKTVSLVRFNLPAMENDDGVCSEL